MKGLHFKGKKQMFNFYQCQTDNETGLIIELLILQLMFLFC